MGDSSVSLEEEVGVSKALETTTPRFRLASKSLFLTYPKCPWEPQNLLDHLKELFSRYKPIFIVVAREKHQDESFHLHVFINLECQFETRNPRAFDLHSEVQLQDCNGRAHVSFHPNIHSRIKSQYKVMKYVTKDGNFIAHGVDVKEFLSRAKNKRSTAPALVAQALMDGKNLREINDADPEFVMMNLKALQAYQVQTVIWNQQKRRSLLQTNPLNVVPTPGYESSWNMAIAEWLNASIRKKRPRKSSQLWISSGPSAGKSTSILRLIRAYELNVYVWPVDEDWFDEYQDGAYDLIWLDEYKSQKTIQTINRIADGMPTSVKRKFQPPITKYDNIPLIICSNGTPQENYHNKLGTVQLAALLARFTVVEVPPGENIRLDFKNNSASPFDEYDLEYIDSQSVVSGLPEAGGECSIPPIFPPPDIGQYESQAVLQVSDSLPDASTHVDLTDDNPPSSLDPLSVDPILSTQSPFSPEPYTRKRVIREFFETEASVKR